MATLDELKAALQASASSATPLTVREPLSEERYASGFAILSHEQDSSYGSFIIPQLSRLLQSTLRSRIQISVLEIGPGPRSVLGQLPENLRERVGEYAAFEPNAMFSSTLKDWLRAGSQHQPPFPRLQSSPWIHVRPFTAGPAESGHHDKYDVILFCHSMYGMKPKRQFIQHALGMLVERHDAMVIVFHRSRSLHVQGLLCRHMACSPSEVVSVPDRDEVLDCFAPFVAGFTHQEGDSGETVRLEWRHICRTLCVRDNASAGHLCFSAPTVMMTFSRHATAFADLATHVPLGSVDHVKNRQARRHQTAFVVRPTELSHVQKCVYWSLTNHISLSVVGGGHGGHCVQPNVVSMDMAAFNTVDLVEYPDAPSGSGFVVAGAGCRSEDIVREALAVGLTVPLGSRPSVGAGLWLQGGIGHLSRLHGLACDAVVGAVVVCVGSGRIMVVGEVPARFQPSDAVRPENEEDLLWALKGAGTNFGIVVAVVLKAFPAVNYSIRQWIAPLRTRSETRQRLTGIDSLAVKLPRASSTDVFLYCDSEGLTHVSVSMSECSEAIATTSSAPPSVCALLGPEDCSNTVDAIGLYETEMYLSSIHGGPGGKKTSSFKRCIFLNSIGQANVTESLLAALKCRPSSLCYLHLLHAGGAVADVAAHATAFGCRDWTFACVITGVWFRDQDASASERAAVDWVYDAAYKLLPLGTGAYGADLGPDPRDIPLAVRSFGPNLHRLACLKQRYDPQHVLAYACPIICPRPRQRLIILVTGQHGVGKDYCAQVWTSALANHIDRGNANLQVRSVCISDVAKAEYAAATGANLGRLLRDRVYKEEHRSALTKFFNDQLHIRPGLMADHFLQVVYDVAEVDVLIITGMRDEDPIANLSPLIPDVRLIEVRVTASNETRRTRRCLAGETKDISEDAGDKSEWAPSLHFHNEKAGDEAVHNFADNFLLRYLSHDLQRLEDMVRIVPNFPRPGIQFRHVLGIAQQPGGLSLCTSLLQGHFPGDWSSIDAVACCEAGGFLFASPLAASVDIPLVLMREACKLPPPMLSVAKSSSHISSSDLGGDGKRIEADRDALRGCRSVVVVDDALASGKTLCAILRLLCKAGIAPERISAMIVAEFPSHRAREMLRKQGFGMVAISSLMVFGGA
ncbi:phosphoribosyl transferase [Cordyceps fumosorosea ARSEF 2679]|uniref:Phosphoribosyl transferase n=1 Tax=Cordyceps fumosorosea (strain ARSEF 2679) TaxID=1081104 RepID=A0A167LJC6_CORFA|nr:phosphoribosyl transferase [Cordyceps fumosorosea ARSEF 2679]OAA53154.1 phosphoribosyl transferase [Cordyceps fumosorosea ARSEF 2679]